MENLKKIVVLTGAGISAESGLKTFRDHDGLWENHNIYEVATYEAFKNNPDLVHRFYNERRSQLLAQEVTFNKAHLALVELEKNISAEMVIITQNVDDLHERAGSKNVLHMHGELLKIRCIKSGKRFFCDKALSSDVKCECCQLAGTLRPDIVWFGEEVYHLDEIYEHLKECDLFVSIGTSGQVFPASHFISFVKKHAGTYEVNLERTQISSYFDIGLYGKASEKVPEFVNNILSLRG